MTEQLEQTAPAVVQAVPPRPASRLPDPLAPLGFRDYRLLTVSNVILYLARWIETIALGWLVLERTDSPLIVSLVGAMRMFPMFFFGPFAGVLADRRDRRQIVTFDQTVALLVTVVIAGLLVLERIEVWHILLASLLWGWCWANDWPSRRGLLVDIVGEQHIMKAVAIDSLFFQAAGIVGGLLGGQLLGAAGVTGSFFVILAMYCVGLGSLLVLNVRPKPAQATQAVSVAANLKEGFRYALSERVILATLFVTVVMNICMFPYKQMLPVFARDVLHVGPQQLGMMAAADSAGALIATLGIVFFAASRWKGAIYLYGSMLMGVALFLFSFSHVFELSLGLLAVLGLGLSGFQNMQSGIILVAAAPEMRGRAIGIMALSIGALPFGMVMLGALASWIGPLESVRLLGAALTLSLLAVNALAPQLRRF